MPSTVRQIAQTTTGAQVHGDGSTLVFDLSHDSQAIQQGWGFVAISGSSHDGHAYVEQAADRGASVVVVESEVALDIPQIVVPNTRIAMAEMAREVHGAPAEGMSIVGVTGTNGKTTVVHMCEAAWIESGRASGIIGTLGARIDGHNVTLARTTPESSDLQRLLGTMKAQGISSVAMEVSSHALELHRADAIRFSAVGFTNLTQDHLDFHGDMETYFSTKQRLFEPGRASTAVIDTGDPWGSRLASTVEIPVLTTGFSPHADIRAEDLILKTDGTQFDLVTPVGTRQVQLPLVGRFNVSNALVAAGLLLADDVSLDDISRGFGAVSRVAGRMDLVRHEGDFTVLVDYAHTPDAIAAALTAARDLADGRLVALVGAGGDRDADKRARMGAAASGLADVTIVTTDNPRSERPGDIADAVKRGADASPLGTVQTIIDRAEAIAYAVSIAQQGDVVVILGKGHEQGQEVMGTVYPFDDYQVAERALQRMGP